MTWPNAVRGGHPGTGRSRLAGVALEFGWVCDALRPDHWNPRRLRRDAATLARLVRDHRRYSGRRQQLRDDRPVASNFVTIGLLRPAADLVPHRQRGGHGSAPTTPQPRRRARRARRSRDACLARPGLQLRKGSLRTSSRGRKVPGTPGHLPHDTGHRDVTRSQHQSASNSLGEAMKTSARRLYTLAATTVGLIAVTAVPAAAGTRLGNHCQPPSAPTQ